MKYFYILVAIIFPLNAGSVESVRSELDNKFFYGRMDNREFDNCLKSKSILQIDLRNIEKVDGMYQLNFLFKNLTNDFLGLDQDYLSSFRHDFNFSGEARSKVKKWSELNIAPLISPPSVLRIISPAKDAVVSFNLGGFFEPSGLLSLHGEHKLEWRMEVKIRNKDNLSICAYSGNLTINFNNEEQE